MTLLILTFNAPSPPPSPTRGEGKERKYARGEEVERSTENNLMKIIF